MKTRAMGRMVMLAVGLAWLGSCGGSSSNYAVCDDILVQTCARREECTGGMTKMADCAAEARKTTNCTQPDVSCPDGKRYNGAVAGMCLSALSGATCADILAGKVASCATVCQ